MKKTLLAIVLLLTILVCTVSCTMLPLYPSTQTTTPESQQTVGGGVEESPETVWALLQKLSQEEYGKVNLDIQIVTGDVELKASYILTNSNVAYSVEQLNLLPSDGDLKNVSQNYKKTISGTATIKNGKVEKFDGKAVDIPTYNELRGAFNFNESNFKNVKVENGKFTADVAFASNFMGTSKNLSNMKIVVKYSETALQKMEITYNTTNSTVTTVYKFTK